MVDKINKTNEVSTSKAIIDQKGIEEKTFFSNSVWNEVEKKTGKKLSKEEYQKAEAKILEEYKKNGGDLSKLSMPNKEKLQEIFEDGQIDETEAMSLIIENKIAIGGINLESEHLKEVTQDEKGTYTATFKNGVKVSYDEQEYNFKNRINSDEDNNTFIDYTKVKAFEGTSKADNVLTYKSSIENFKGNGGNDYLNAEKIDEKREAVRNLLSEKKIPEGKIDKIMHNFLGPNSAIDVEKMKEMLNDPNIYKILTE